jgi:hypothetical protein
MNTGRVIQGFVVVVIGIILLLNQQGLIDWSIWPYLIQFWPVLLIIWGIQLIFNKSKFSLWLSLFLLIGVLAVAYGLWNSYEYSAGSHDSVLNQENIPVESDIKEAKLKLDYGAGQLHILDSKDAALTLNYNYPKPKIDSQTKGKEAEYKIYQGADSWPRFIPNRVGGEWALQLPQGVVWDVDMNVGAIKGELDFKEIDLNTLDLNAGAGDITLQLGDRGLSTKIKINAVASNIKVMVPDTVNLQFSLVGAINDHNLDDAGLVKMGDYYVFTPSNRAYSKLELELTGAANRLELVRIPEGS